MNNSIAIQVENLSKAYQLGQIGTGTISRDLERYIVTKILRKEDPFLKIGQTNNRTIKGDSDIVWSLKDINFEINQGDAVGIIGRNGAGKSTLLKLLSRVTSPTTGNIKVKGRIASLLEVGTGFHPELSGRENIYLNGAILGMRKTEIQRKFDEIVDFAGVERYIDTPVKRYSSGMYVRLAFAVAAHLESEILIVDEVLAVGDAEFQKKCLGKMGDISKGEGRTILFVSHNMSAIQTLCRSSLVLESGGLAYKGEVNNAIANYLRSNEISNTFLNQTKGNIKLHYINTFQNDTVDSFDIVDVFEPFGIKAKFEFLNSIPSDLKIELVMKDEFGQIMTTTSTWLNSISITPKKSLFEFECFFKSGLPFKDGCYIFSLKIFGDNLTEFDSVLKIELVNNPKFTGYKFPLKPHLHGFTFTPNNWKIMS